MTNERFKRCDICDRLIKTNGACTAFCSRAIFHCYYFEGKLHLTEKAKKKYGAETILELRKQLL
jgi:hypothetical protein